ncbi:hypothetical protein BGZ63DRAFT_247565 [Mariannaea sp. PMI_226]|nr:hypothetical protein BGZ63DRAFT_247565 [Mariannaea sp. PMI_226]
MSNPEISIGIGVSVMLGVKGRYSGTNRRSLAITSNGDFLSGVCFLVTTLNSNGVAVVASLFPHFLFALRASCLCLWSGTFQLILRSNHHINHTRTSSLTSIPPIVALPAITLFPCLPQKIVRTASTSPAPHGPCICPHSNKRRPPFVKSARVSCPSWHTASTPVM